MAERASRRPATFIGVLTALSTIACTEDDPCEGLRTFDRPPEPEPGPNAAPEVLSGEWIGTGVLELQFSKPLLPTSSPDPSRFAIMVWSAQANTYYGADTCQQQTAYRLLGRTYFYYYSYNNNPRPVADVWIAPDDPSILRLRLANVGAVCQANTNEIEAGLTLVYTNGEASADGVERLLDAEGDPVPGLGPDWAISRWDNCALEPSGYCGYTLNNVYQGHLPFWDPLPPIPCPGT